MSREGCYSHRSIADKTERFFAKVEKTEGSCWIWLGHIDAKGYGVFGVGERRLCKAHRFSYELQNGPIPDGLFIDHLCRVRCCVNPAHMEPVTNRENVIRGNAARGPKRECKHGHAMIGDNIFINARGDRECQICRRGAMQRRNRRIQCAA